MAAVCEALAAKWMFSLVAGGDVSHWAPPPPALLGQWEVESSLGGGETPEHSPHSFCFTIISHQFTALLSRAGGFQRRTCFVHDQGIWKQRDYRFMGLFQHRILTLLFIQSSSSNNNFCSSNTTESSEAD